MVSFGHSPWERRPDTDTRKPQVTSFLSHAVKFRDTYDLALAEIYSKEKVHRKVRKLRLRSPRNA